MVAVCSMARPFGKVRPRRDVVNNPAGGRRGSRRGISGRDGREEEEKPGLVRSGIQGDTLVDQVKMDHARQTEESLSCKMRDHECARRTFVTDKPTIYRCSQRYRSLKSMFKTETLSYSV